MSRQLIGVNIGSYTFTPGISGVGTVTLLGIEDLTLDQVLVITNVTDNDQIYNFADPNLGGAISETGNIITLDVDTSGMSASDILQIWVEYSDSSSPTNVIITGATGDSVDPIGGSVPVTFPAPTAPAASTPVEISRLINAAAFSNEYVILDIPSEATEFILLSFEADATDVAKSTSAYVYYDPDGDAASGANSGTNIPGWGDTLGANWELVVPRLNISSNPADKSFSASNKKVGTASNRYIGRIKRNDGGTDDIFIKLTGYWT